MPVQVETQKSTAGRLRAPSKHEHSSRMASREQVIVGLGKMCNEHVKKQKDLYRMSRLSVLFDSFKKRSKSVDVRRNDSSKCDAKNPAVGSFPPHVLIASNKCTGQATCNFAPVNITGSVHERYRLFRDSSREFCTRRDQQYVFNGVERLSDRSNPNDSCSPGLSRPKVRSHTRPSSFHPISSVTYSNPSHHNPYLYQNNLKISSSRKDPRVEYSGHLDNVNGDHSLSSPLCDSLCNYPPSLAPYPCPTVQLLNPAGPNHFLVHQKLPPTLTASVDPLHLHRRKKPAHTSSSVRLRPVSDLLDTVCRMDFMDQSRFSDRATERARLLSTCSAQLSRGANSSLPPAAFSHTGLTLRGSKLIRDTQTTPINEPKITYAFNPCFGGPHKHLQPNVSAKEVCQVTVCHTTPKLFPTLVPPVPDHSTKVTHNDTDTGSGRMENMNKLVAVPPTFEPDISTTNPADHAIADKALSCSHSKPLVVRSSVPPSCVVSSSSSSNCLNDVATNSTRWTRTSLEQNGKQLTTLPVGYPTDNSHLSNGLGLIGVCATVGIPMAEGSDLATVAAFDAESVAVTEKHRLTKWEKPPRDKCGFETSGFGCQDTGAANFSDRCISIPPMPDSNDFGGSGVKPCEFSRPVAVTSKSVVRTQARPASALLFPSMGLPPPIGFSSGCRHRSQTKSTQASGISLAKTASDATHCEVPVTMDSCPAIRYSASNCTFAPLVQTGAHSCRERGRPAVAPVLRPPRPPLRTTSLVRGFEHRDSSCSNSGSVGSSTCSGEAVEMNSRPGCQGVPRNDSSSSCPLPAGPNEIGDLADKWADGEVEQVVSQMDSMWWLRLLPYKPSNLPDNLADRLRQRGSLMLSRSSPNSRSSNSSLPTPLTQPHVPISQLTSFKSSLPTPLMTQSMYEHRLSTVEQTTSPDSTPKASIAELQVTWQTKPRIPVRPSSLYTEKTATNPLLLPSLAHLASTCANETSVSEMEQNHWLHQQTSFNYPHPTFHVPAAPSVQPCDIRSSTARTSANCPSVTHLADWFSKSTPDKTNSPLLGQYCRLLILRTTNAGTPTTPAEVPTPSAGTPATPV
ncbi:hypothetical protein P879_01092 [Paragonimus westermani]|uniref:Uncharacterized protein n=1 Tax=Paragonimus westermani TaxID=34504 RepID=A0A8T0DXL4_9TREM|nr:hypothetical protein P879_01092 [Paragonimus westermani]